MRPLFAISAAILAARFGSPLSMTITASSPPSTAMFPPAPVIRLNFPPRELETIRGAVGDALGLGLAARAPGLRKLKAPGNAVPPRVNRTVRNASRRVKPEPWRENVRDIARNEFHAKTPKRKAQTLLRKGCGILLHSLRLRA